MINLINGARWWKFDFHNHTPKSSDFGKGDSVHTAITPSDWLLMYMNQGIDCVAITDHNSGEWVDELKKALADMKLNPPEGFRDLVLFPGVEITASNNIHILAIFDPSAATKEIHALLGAISFPTAHFGTSDAVSPKTVEEIINEIHKAGAIAIPAHVDCACGLFNLTGHTLTQAIKVDDLLAIEIIDKAFVKPELYKQARLQLAEVLGSDSHIAAQVGSLYTWVKMGEPSLDALSLALHDCEDGVIRKEEIETNPNLIASRYFIRSVEIANGFKAGNGGLLKANLSPWLSSVIGGRGSGKSSIVNYLRIALHRVTDMPDDVQAEFDRFNQIGKKNGPGMLRDTTSIKVEIFKDGKLHLVTWTIQETILQTWNEDSGNWDPATPVTNVKELFPVQIFSQKELYALTGNPSKLIELIDSQFDKQGWVERKDELVNKWLSQRTTRRQLKAAISEENNLKAQLEAADNKIALFESSDYKDTLENFNRLTATSNFFGNTATVIGAYITDLEKLYAEIPVIQPSPEISSLVQESSEDLIDPLAAALALSTEKMKDAIAILEPFKLNLKGRFEMLPWFAKYIEAKAAYEAIQDKIQELGSETYEVLIQRRSSLKAKLTQVEIQKKELESTEANLIDLIGKITEHEKELRKQRREIISRWKEVDSDENPFLMIDLQPMADFESANSTFRKLIRKEGAEFSNYIYSFHDDGPVSSNGILASIIKENEDTRWNKRWSEIVNFVSATESDPRGFDMRLIRHLNWLKENTPEDIDRLGVWFPEDKLVLSFKKQGKPEDIQTGSAGERTAGMLGLLLALNNIPLIIDQPEDDLDTRLISNFVVPGFKKLKQRRQLMLVTHNANIAVNANSDTIVHMNYAAGQIVVDGNDALQDKKIRLAVCNIMEGGKDALFKRYYRISKALK